MSDKLIKAIAVLEIVGGVVGLLFIIYVSVASAFAFTVMVVVPISLGIYLLSLFAGFYLWKGTEFGRKTSIAVQLIQLPKIVSPAFTFMFSFGFDLFTHFTINYDRTNLGFEFRLFADGQLFFMTEGGPFLLGLSITALVALVKLTNYNIDDPISTAAISEIPPSPREYDDLIEISNGTKEV